MPGTVCGVQPTVKPPRFGVTVSGSLAAAPVVAGSAVAGSRWVKVAVPVRIHSGPTKSRVSPSAEVEVKGTAFEPVPRAGSGSASLVEE
jgi:hypothetical protein